MKKRPNIVFILSDDQGAFSLGCLNNSELKTPNLDKLAKRGILFENCYCASPVCSPARATILTGTMPSAHGVHDWIRGGNLNPDDFTLTQEQKKHYDYRSEHKAIDYLAGMPSYTKSLADNGYTCALSGKWHLGDSARAQCGFTKWYTIGKGGCCSYMDPDIMENGELSFPKQYVTDLITDKAVEYVRELAQGEDPFYLSVHYTAPHVPWEADSHKKENLELYKQCDYEKYFPHQADHPFAIDYSKECNAAGRWKFEGYEASITAMDEGIGRVMGALSENNLLDNTLVIFTGDNGFNLGHHGLFGKGNATCPPNMYDTSIKVPFIISYPLKIYKDIKTTYTISHYDLFPTILELAEIDYSLTDLQPGHSFVPALMGEESEDHDVVIYDEYGATRMIRTEQYKYVHHFVEGTHEMYDLYKDANEETNLYDKEEYHPLILRLRKRMYKWFADHTDPRRDGVKESVDGSGQLCRCGEEAELFQVFSALRTKEKKFKGR